MAYTVWTEGGRGVGVTIASNGLGNGHRVELVVVDGSIDAVHTFNAAGCRELAGVLERAAAWLEAGVDTRGEPFDAAVAPAGAAS